MNISTKYQLAADQFYNESVKKRAIVLHHTVSSNVESVFHWWQNDAYPDGEPRRVGTAFVIEKDGTVFQMFDPDRWAHHLGCRHPLNKITNKESIGIELVNEGGLTPRGDAWFWFTGRAQYHGEVFHCSPPWRGYLAFAQYPQAQLASCFELVNELCATFGILRHVPADPFGYDLEILKFFGIFAHCNVRQDKTDIHCGFPVAALAEYIKNNP